VKSFFAKTPSSLSVLPALVASFMHLFMAKYYFQSTLYLLIHSFTHSFKLLQNMKAQFSLMLIFTYFFALFINETLSRRGGAPAGRSGEPPANITCTNGCHNSFALNSGIGMPSISTDIPEGGYTADSTYTITARIEQAGISRFGFQVVSVDAEVNEQIGTISLIDQTRTRLMFSATKTYVTHQSNSTDNANANSWAFNWTAPSTGAREVIFYGAFVAANANGNNKGDYVYTTSDTKVGALKTTREPLYIAGLNIYYASEQKKIQIEMEAESFFTAEISVIDLSGKRYFEASKELILGSYYESISTASWAPAIYIVLIATNKGQVHKKVVVY